MAKCNQGEGVQIAVEPVKPAIQINCFETGTTAPTEPPNSDELPFYYDKSSDVLYFWSCDDQKWYDLDNSLCSLSDVDIGVLNNACAELKVPVTYFKDGKCIEGKTTLQTFSNELKKCLNLRTYVAGDNITFSPPNSNNEVTISTNSPTTVSAGTGIGVKKTDNDYQVSTELCSLTEYTTAQLKAAGSKYLIACADNVQIKVPLDIIPEIPPTQEIWDCVPTVNSVPTTPPAAGKPPFAIGCNGLLYIWLCGEDAKWVSVGDDTNHPAYNDGDVGDVCNNLKLNVHFETGDCPSIREMTMKQLATIIKQCGDFKNKSYRATVRSSNGSVTVTPSSSTDADGFVTGDDYDLSVNVPAPFNPCALPKNNEPPTSITELIACISGVPQKIPYPTIPDPVLKRSFRPVIISTNNTSTITAQCFTMPTFFAYDSRTTPHHGGVVAPGNFTVSNPTPNPGRVIIDARGHFSRHAATAGSDPENNTILPQGSQVLFMVGYKSATDTYQPLNSIQTTAAYDVEYLQTNTAFEISQIPPYNYESSLEWFAANTGSAGNEFKVFSCSAASLSFSFDLAANSSIELAGIILAKTPKPSRLNNYPVKGFSALKVNATFIGYEEV